MAAEVPGTPERQPPPSKLARWLQLGAAALLLLVVSETLWLWQTWPVRELVAPPARPAQGAR